MNKDQFAYLNMEIKDLESERDALRKDLDRTNEIVMDVMRERDHLRADLKSSNDHAMRQDGRMEDYQREIEKLKEELESKKSVIKSLNKGHCGHAEQMEIYMFDMETWKFRAEALAEGVQAAQFALHHFKNYSKTIEKIVGPGEWEAFRRYIRTGVEALAAYRTAAQKEGQP